MPTIVIDLMVKCYCSANVPLNRLLFLHGGSTVSIQAKSDFHTVQISAWPQRTLGKNKQRLLSTFNLKQWILGGHNLLNKHFEKVIDLFLKWPQLADSS